MVTLMLVLLFNDFYAADGPIKSLLSVSVHLSVYASAQAFFSGMAH